MGQAARLTSPGAVLDALRLAVAHHQKGELAQAQGLYDRILRAVPTHADALHLSGVLKLQGGDPAAGAALIRKAVRQDGTQPSYHLNLGRCLEGAGQPGEAADSYARAVGLAPGLAEPRKREGLARARLNQHEAAARCLGAALDLDPDDAETASALGDALYDLGRFAQAVEAYRRAVALRPDMTVAAFNIGAALRDAGRLGEAVAAFRELAARAPVMPQAHEQLVLLHHRLGQWSRLEAAARRLLALAPGHADAARRLGAALDRAKRRAAAASWLTRALVLQPELDDVLLALGALRQRGGQRDEARLCYRLALAVAPASAAALSNLGLAESEGAAGEAAVRALTRAVRLVPENAATAANLGSAHHRLKRREEARRWARRALALQPDSALGWANDGLGFLSESAFEEAIPLLHRALALDDGTLEPLLRSNIGMCHMSMGRQAEAAASFRAALVLAPQDSETRSNLLFCLCFAEAADLDEVFEEHRRFERFLPPQPGASNFETASFETIARDPERRIRLGYLSPDFQRYPGPGYHFLLPLLERHDRAAFEIVCYYNDVRQDEATRRFQALADGWRDCATLSDRELDRRIRDDAIDVLIDCDGHMSRNRMPLFAGRPAPLQVSFPLYPNTTGLSAMDYRFADRHFAPPGADARHSEKLIRLPDCLLCYRPAESAVTPPVRPPAEESGIVTFGSFNNLAKLNGPTVALWARVLRTAPNARLMLKWRGLTTQGVGRRVLDAFAAHGIGPERLVLRGPTTDPYEDYVLLDVALDPVFANGGTTSCDALWMGVPVLTIMGEASISRWGVSLLCAVGLEELATRTAEEYVALAARLAAEPALLARLRAGLRERVAASPLMDAGGYARALEAGYRTAWRRWCAGQPAEGFSVPPQGG